MSRLLLRPSSPIGAGGSTWRQILYIAAATISARELERWGENIAKQGKARLRTVLRVFKICKVSAWVIRDSRPTHALMDQGLVHRCRAACVMTNPRRFQFSESGGDVAAASAQGESKDVRNRWRRSKRITVFAKVAEQRSVFSREN